MTNDHMAKVSNFRCYAAFENHATADQNNETVPSERNFSD